MPVAGDPPAELTARCNVRGELATNAALVERVVRIAGELERPVATLAQARELLGLG